jgi:hypothetical protein
MAGTARAATSTNTSHSGPILSSGGGASGQLQFHGLLRGLAQPRLCHMASSGSGTSVSSQAAAVGRWFHFASNYFRSVCPRRRRHQITPTRDSIGLRSGPTRYAAARCLWSSVSPLFRSSSVLHRKAKLPEVRKPIHCRSFNSSASGCYSCASAIPILGLACLLTASPGVLRPESYFPIITSYL